MRNIEKKQNQSKNDFYASLYEGKANPLTNTTVNDQSEYKDALKLGLRKDAFQSIPDVSSQNLLVDNQNDILKNIVVRNQDHSKDNQIEPVDGKNRLKSK